MRHKHWDYTHWSSKYYKDYDRDDRGRYNRHWGDHNREGSGRKREQPTTEGSDGRQSGGIHQLPVFLSVAYDLQRVRHLHKHPVAICRPVTGDACIGGSGRGGTPKDGEVRPSLTKTVATEIQSNSTQITSSAGTVLTVKDFIWLTYQAFKMKTER